MKKINHIKSNRTLIIFILIVTLPLLLESLNCEVEKVDSIDFNNENNKNNIHGISFINDNMSELKYISFKSEESTNFYKDFTIVSFDSKFEVNNELPLKNMLYYFFSKYIDGNIFYVNFDSLNSYIIPLDSLATDSLTVSKNREKISNFFNICYYYEGLTINRKKFHRDYFCVNSFFYNQFYYYVSNQNYSIIEYDVVKNNIRIINFNFKETKMGKFKDFEIVGFNCHKMVLYNQISGSIIFYDLLTFQWEYLPYDMLCYKLKKNPQTINFSIYITSNNLLIMIEEERYTKIYKLLIED